LTTPIRDNVSNTVTKGKPCNKYSQGCEHNYSPKDLSGFASTDRILPMRS